MELKLKIIKGNYVMTPRPQLVLDFVNSEKIDKIVSIVFDGNEYKIFYY